MPPRKNILCHVCGNIFQYKSQVDVHILHDHPQNSKVLRRLSSVARDSAASSPAPFASLAVASPPAAEPSPLRRSKRVWDEDDTLEVPTPKRRRRDTRSPSPEVAPRTPRTAAVAAQTRLEEQLVRTPKEAPASSAAAASGNGKKRAAREPSPVTPRKRPKQRGAAQQALAALMSSPSADYHNF